MRKKYSLLLLPTVFLIIVALNLSMVNAVDSVTITSQNTGVVEKLPGDAFTVTITFENTGSTSGQWSVTPVFESTFWSWIGAAKDLSLSANAKSTLIWNGVVPSNAPADSIARLVMYYGNSYKILDWWIHITLDAQLNIQASNVS